MKNNEEKEQFLKAFCGEYPAFDPKTNTYQLPDHSKPIILESGHHFRQDNHLYKPDFRDLIIYDPRTNLEIVFNELSQQQIDDPSNILYNPFRHQYEAAKTIDYLVNDFGYFEQLMGREIKIASFKPSPAVKAAAVERFNSESKDNKGR